MKIKDGIKFGIGLCVGTLIHGFVSEVTAMVVFSSSKLVRNKMKELYPEDYKRYMKRCKLKEEPDETDFVEE